MSRIINKVNFVLGITGLGANISSKFILLFNALYIQKNFYTHGSPRPFSARIKSGSNTSKVTFQGTLDEMHALTEIFIDRCYAPHTAGINKILDLGANIGLASIWFKLNYPNALVHAYEPNPTIYKILETNLKSFNDCFCFNSAVSGSEGELVFYVSSRTFASSTFPIGNSTPIRIPSVTLDGAIKKIGSPVEVLKIDIEGAEFEAIRNSELLGGVNEIVGEIHPEKTMDTIENFNSTLSRTHNIIDSIHLEKSIFRALLKNSLFS